MAGTLAAGEHVQQIAWNQNLIVDVAGNLVGIQNKHTGADMRGFSGTVVNDLTTGGTSNALSAAQGVVLSNLIAAGGGGGGTNTVIDGGNATSNYGGSTPIDGGTATT